MDLHNKLTKDHFAWFDKNIASDYGNAPSEAAQPLDVFEEAVLKHKFKNHLPLDSNIDIIDVMYDNNTIGVDNYHLLGNSFSDLETRKIYRLVNGVKTFTGFIFSSLTQKALDNAR